MNKDNLAYLDTYQDQYKVQCDYVHTHNIIGAYGLDCDESDTYLVVQL